MTDDEEFTAYMTFASVMGFLCAEYYYLVQQSIVSTIVAALVFYTVIAFHMV